MKRQEVRQFFMKHCESQQKGKLTVAQYCGKHNLKVSQFYYWKREFLKKDVSCTESPKRSFQKITVPSPIVETIQESIVITLPNGISIRHDGQDFTVSELSTLVQELRREYV
ncbi:MAG: hypothetical protein GY817_03815 [bacterium]|nr:hypothetical protein [bacterium]